MTNIEDALARIKRIKNLSLKRDIAALFKVSASDFSNRLKRETLLPLITNWGINENVNLNWLLTGQGEPYINEKENEPVPSPKEASLYIEGRKEIRGSLPQEDINNFDISRIVGKAVTEAILETSKMWEDKVDRKIGELDKQIAELKTENTLLKNLIEGKLESVSQPKDELLDQYKAALVKADKDIELLKISNNQLESRLIQLGAPPKNNKTVNGS